MGNTKRIGYLIIGSGLLFYSIFSQWQWQHQPASGAKIVALNVGQGDAIYMHTTSGVDILIDGGPDASVLEQLDHVMPFWDHTLELVILTHPHADHLNGLLAVMQHYTIQRVWLTAAVVEHNPTYQIWLQQLQQQSTVIQFVQAGDAIQFSTNESFAVLYPFLDTPLTQLEDLNDTSLVVQYSLDNKHALFMGDATSLVESQLISRGVVQPAEILKIGHHGSKYSSSPEFLAVVQPNYAIISAGVDNAYRHPHTETLQRLQAIGANIMRTDTLNTVELNL